MALVPNETGKVTHNDGLPQKIAETGDIRASSSRPWKLAWVANTVTDGSTIEFWENHPHKEMFLQSIPEGKAMWVMLKEKAELFVTCEAPVA